MIADDSYLDTALNLAQAGGKAANFVAINSRGLQDLIGDFASKPLLDAIVNPNAPNFSNELGFVVSNLCQGSTVDAPMLLTNPTSSAPFILTDYQNKDLVLGQIAADLAARGCLPSIIAGVNLAVWELMMNAVFDAVPFIGENRTTSIAMADAYAVRITWHIDEERIVIVVADSFGTLDKAKTIAALSRHLKTQNSGVDSKTFGTGASAGLYMALNAVHSLYYLVHEDIATEAVIIANLSPRQKIYSQWPKSLAFLKKGVP